MGKATTEVKIEKMASAVSCYTSNRKIWMGLNLMGDPEMPLYIALTNLDTTIEDLIVVGNLEVVIAEEEPNWINGRPDCFDNDEAKRCIIYQGKRDKQ